MIKLDYYTRTNSYELEQIMTDGLFFDYYMDRSKYGKGVHLTYKNNRSWNRNPISLKIHLKNLDNILNVKNFDDFVFLLNKIDIISSTNINIENAPEHINSMPLKNGDLINLIGQNNISENGTYIFAGKDSPLLFYGNVPGYIQQYGVNKRFGDRFSVPYLINNGYNGIKIDNEKLLVLFNNKNIDNISVV